MNKYFTSFRLLTHLGLTTSEQRVCSTKIGYANALSLRTNSTKKGNMVGFNSAHQPKKRNPHFTVADLNENIEVYV